MNPQLTQTAIHEAGHAIAVKLRKGTVKSVTIDPGLIIYYLPRHRETSYRNGQLIDNPVYGQIGEPDAFVAFAGPWAVARARWGYRPLTGLDDQGRSFSAYVAEALWSQRGGDLDDYQAVELPDGIVERWHSELLDNWPAIVAEAQVLLTVHREEIHWRRVRVELARDKKLKAIKRNKRSLEKVSAARRSR